MSLKMHRKFAISSCVRGGLSSIYTVDSWVVNVMVACAYFHAAFSFDRVNV